MTGPGDGRADRGRFRASHDDRDRVIELLKSAFVEGRLAKDEFDERVGQAIASRTYAELGTLTDDIPPPRPREVVRARRPGRPVQKVVLATVAGTIAPVLFVVAILLNSDGMARALTMPVMFTVMAWVAGVAQMLDARHSRRVAGQPPPRHAQRHRPLEAGQDGLADDHLILCPGPGLPAAGRLGARA
jgi:Domain of unknown function (DUF1707)